MPSFSVLWHNNISDHWWIFGRLSTGILIHGFRKNWKKRDSTWSEKFNNKRMNRKENCWRCNVTLKSESA